MGTLDQKVTELRQEQEEINKVAAKSEMKGDDMSRILQKLPELEWKKRNLFVHLDLAKRISNSMRGADRDIMQIIEQEQTILSGMDDNGKKVSDDNMAKIT